MDRPETRLQWVCGPQTLDRRLEGGRSLVQAALLGHGRVVQGLDGPDPWPQCVFELFFLFVAGALTVLGSAGSAAAGLSWAGWAGKRKWAIEASCALQIALHL